jgi:hypothetical protein
MFGESPLLGTKSIRDSRNIIIGLLQFLLSGAGTTQVWGVDSAGVSTSVVGIAGFKWGSRKGVGHIGPIWCLRCSADSVVNQC